MTEQLTQDQQSQSTDLQHADFAESAKTLIDKLDELVARLSCNQNWRLYQQKIDEEIAHLVLTTAKEAVPISEENS